MLEDEVVVEGGSRTPALGGQFGNEFRLGGVRAFDVGLGGPDYTVAAIVPRYAQKPHFRRRNLDGEFRHTAEILERRVEAKAVGIIHGAADHDFPFLTHHDPCVVLGSATLRAALLFEPGDFLGVDLGGAGAKGVFGYRVLRELAKRLFCRN